MLRIRVKNATYIVKLQGNKLICKVENPLRHYCGGTLLLHDIGAWHKVLDGYALDIHLKCTKCHEYTTHGVPSKSIQCDEDIKKYCAKIITNFVEVNDETKEVIERLRDWGYW